jgi:acylphosphatase
VTGRDGGTGTVRRRVLIHGRVQAVGFRASCLARAADAQVAGWVRNTEHGDVEAAFEGSPLAVEALVAWCRQGPAWARVDGIEITEEDPRHDTTFRIR